MQSSRQSLAYLVLVLLSTPALLAQDRPELFFREDWKETPPATPVTQEHVSNPDLLVSRYGPGEAGVKKSHHERPADDPFYIWSGETRGNWALTLRHKRSFVDLRGLAKIRWRGKQAGFRQLRIVLKTGSGEWIVSDDCDGSSADWRIKEFNLGDIHWRKLDIQAILEGDWVATPDLSRVDEVGVTDLMTGGNSLACSRLDWIEVYGKSVPR